MSTPENQSNDLEVARINDKGSRIFYVVFLVMLVIVAAIVIGSSFVAPALKESAVAEVNKKQEMKVSSITADKTRLGSSVNKTESPHMTWIDDRTVSITILRQPFIGSQNAPLTLHKILGKLRENHVIVQSYDLSYELVNEWLIYVKPKVKEENNG